MENGAPRGKVRGTLLSSAESAEAYPPSHKASEGYPFRIHPQLKAVVFAPSP